MRSDQDGWQARRRMHWLQRNAAAALGVVTALTMAGCLTVSGPSSGVFTQHSTAREVAEARRLIEAGEPDAAIPRLVQITSVRQESDTSLDARFWLGVAYAGVNSYRDAIDVFQEYLRLAPQGEHAAQSAEYLARLKKEYNERFLSPEQLDNQIRTLSGRLKQTPGDFGIQWELADLLWQRGDYELAGELYVAIVKDHPEYAQDVTVVKRIELMPSGRYVVLSPTELERREVKKRPLTIFNVSSFRSGSDRFTRARKYYVVTGQVMNRGDSVLYQVQVIVTIYGFGNTVYDSKAVNLGRLNPGEVRAFSVQFRHFDSIDNIHRYECVGRFQQ